MDSLLRDFRHAVRNLARTPGFALVTILTLALGIGANTAIFSVVNAVILRPLGYPHPEQLVYISSQFPAMGFDQFWISPPEFLEFQERTHAFAVVGAFATGQANLTAPDRPRRVNAGQASADLFKALGVNAQYGRTFDAAETRPNGPRVTILSNELWKSAFGGSASTLNSEIEINGVRRQRQHPQQRNRNQRRSSHGDWHHAAALRRRRRTDRAVESARPRPGESDGEPRQPLSVSDRPAPPPAPRF